LKRSGLLPNSSTMQPSCSEFFDDKFVFSYGGKKPADKATYIKEFTDGDIDPTESQTLSDESVIVDRTPPSLSGPTPRAGQKKVLRTGWCFDTR